MAHDRMFHVIVLGGMGLVACGGSLASTPDAPADAAADAFPSEGAAAIDGGSIEPGDALPPSDAPSFVDVFPAEGPAIFDAFPDEGSRDAQVADGSVVTDGSGDGGLRDAQIFPSEGPPPPR
jgi:hypothetical protein